MWISKKELKVAIEASYSAGGWPAVQKWLDQNCVDERIKVTEFEKTKVREAYRRGDTLAHISAQFNLSEPTLRKILGVSRGALELDKGLVLRPASR